MKKVIMAVLALSLMLSVIPAMAETTSQTPALQAMSNLSTVVPMTDQQLASVEGEGYFQLNIARIRQANVFCVVAICNNTAVVVQTNVN